MWRKLVGRWAEYVAHSLYGGRSSRTRCLPGIKTPLTQRHRREAKTASEQAVAVPKMMHVCRGCGNPVHRKSAECWNCAQSTRAETISAVAQVGRISSQRPDAREKLARTARKQAIARFRWDASQLPSWLTREFFIERIQPKLTQALPSRLRDSLNVSHYYATKIRKGHVPHPQHWKLLAELVKASLDA